MQCQSAHEATAKEGSLKVVDESGEDYLYPESQFILVQLPREAQDALLAVSQSPEVK